LFDPTDRKFLEAYFTEVHHPLEDEGVDFWWIDWQQGNFTRTEGIDPMWMLNHYHFMDSKRRLERRMTFSRFAGPGNQRYPIGFSGVSRPDTVHCDADNQDTEILWSTLSFQPEFTATSANIGYGWWSHDIGGHHHGITVSGRRCLWS
jgi:alpha-glucosidase (family GH31 glycosyl hydrolase)